MRVRIGLLLVVTSIATAYINGQTLTEVRAPGLPPFALELPEGWSYLIEPTDADTPPLVLLYDGPHTYTHLKGTVEWEPLPAGTEGEFGYAVEALRAQLYDPDDEVPDPEFFELRPQDHQTALEYRQALPEAPGQVEHAFYYPLPPSLQRPAPPAWLIVRLLYDTTATDTAAAWHAVARSLALLPN